VIGGVLGLVVVPGTAVRAAATHHGRHHLSIRKVTPTSAEIAAAAPVTAPNDSLGTWQASMRSDYPGTYGGLYIDASGSYVVTTVGTAAALRRAASAGFAAATAAPAVTAGATRLASVAGAATAPTLGFATTPYSMDDLIALKAAILANQQFLNDGVVGAELDLENGVVNVFTSGGAVDAALQADYGAEIEITGASTSSLTASRSNDSPPWNAGDAIVGSNGNGCTSGFGLRNTRTGATYQLTAGHCGSTNWYNTSFSNQQLNNYVGSTVSGTDVTNGIDAQLIADPSDCISWGANGSRIYITGYADAPQGATIWLEGANGGHQVGTVLGTDWSGAMGSEQLGAMDQISAGPYAGDSGGPMVYPTGFGPLAAGSIVGILWNKTGTNAWGMVQEIDAELYDYSALLGSSIAVNVTTTGSSC
jgi:hypothetical protein